MSDSVNVSPGTEGSSAPASFQELDDGLVQDVLIKKRLTKASRRKKVFGIAGLVIILAAAGWGVYKWMGSDTKPEYLTAVVSKSTITDTIEATGTLEPVKKSELGFKNDGTIILLNVQPGDHVTEGQILAQQNSTTLKTALDQANSSLLQDQLSLQSSTMTYETNLKTAAQQEKLFEAGVIAETELDSARNTLRKSELDVASAKAKLANDQAKVAQAQSDLDDATLVAPFDGIIGAVNGQVGQINGINSSSSTLLTVISEELQLSALVNEADIGRIKVGQDVEFTSTAYTDQVFRGKVLRVTPEAESVSNVQYYPVLISCIDPDHQLFSGMSVSADIIVVRETDVLTVPMMAVSFAQTYLKQNPDSLGSGQTPNAKPAAGQPQAAGSPPVSAPASMSGDQAPAAGVREKSSSAGSSTDLKSDSTRGMVVVLENGNPVIKSVILGLNNGSSYKVIEGLNEGDQVIVGSNSVDNSSAGTTTNTRNQQNQRGGMGGGMGGPPPGF